MKVLLDVYTPVRVRQALQGHDVRTAGMMGWGELENGDVLREAEAAGIDLLVICDEDLRHRRGRRRRAGTHSAARGC